MVLGGSFPAAQFGEEPDVAGNDEGHKKRRQQAEREPQQGSHGARVADGEAGRPDNDEQDISQAQDVPA